MGENNSLPGRRRVAEKLIITSIALSFQKSADTLAAGGKESPMQVFFLQSRKNVYFSAVNFVRCVR